MNRNVIIAGHGGQGVLLAGNLLACAGLLEGHNVCFFPTYGVEKRGGAATCTITIADEIIGSPVVSRPQAALLFNQGACDRYFSNIRPQGFCLLNGSLASPAIVRNDLDLVILPLIELALELGDIRLANMIALGAYARSTGTVALASLKTALGTVLAERHHRFIPLNEQALDLGAGQCRPVTNLPSTPAA